MTVNSADLLTTAGLPPGGYPPGLETKWLYNDDLDNYRKFGGHPVYGEDDITYKFNSLGYRCPEFTVNADIRIVAVGCSYVMGFAMPSHALFHEVFAKWLREQSGRSVVVWNLGRSAGSNDYISRMLYSAVPHLNPHIVLINFTHPGRREYISIQDRWINYNPSTCPQGKVAQDIFKHFDALGNPLDDRLNFYKNYKAVEHFLLGRQWLYSHIMPETFSPIAGHMDLNRYVGRLTFIDRARDRSHPGPESHRRLAEFYWNRFCELGGLQ